MVKRSETFQTWSGHEKVVSHACGSVQVLRETSAKKMPCVTPGVSNCSQKFAAALWKGGFILIAAAFQKFIKLPGCHGLSNTGPDQIDISFPARFALSEGQQHIS